MKKFTLLMAALLVAVVTMAVPMTGTYRVGTGEVAPNYATLSAAVTDINANGVGGDIELQITSDITETINIGLINSSIYTISIRPDADADRTITFNKTTDNAGPSGAFCIGIGMGLAWADLAASKNVVIDGFAVGGTTKRLKFVTATTSYIGNGPILIIGDCSNIQIKNCIINHVATLTGSTGNYGIYIRLNTTYGSKMPSSITVENNEITVQRSSASQGIGIYAGTGTTGITSATGIVIKKNIITTVTRGVFLNYINGIDILENEFHINQTTSGNLSAAVFGNSTLSGNINVERNKFIEFKTANSSAGAFGIRGIIASGGGTWYINNNFFTGFDKTTTTAGETMLQGIRCGSSCNIRNNTFFLNSLTNKPTYIAAPTDANGSYCAINIAAGTNDIKNNIFISNEDAVTNFAIRGTVAAGTSDYNVFYARAGIVNARVNSTYPLYTDYVTTGGVDSHSKNNTDVNFVNAAIGDLRIAGVSLQDANLAVPALTAVPTDMFGTVRSTSTYAGAHEALLPFVISSVGEIQQTARIMRTASGIQVDLDGEAAIELYSINGMLIEKTKVSGTYSHDLNNGMYIIRVNGKATKFIK